MTDQSVTKTKRQRRPDDRPAEILAAALSVFARKGFSQARMEDIAKRAELSKGALYLYFPDKVTLLKALVTQASSAIPIMPLYISILYKIMKEQGTHEGCIEQIQGLFARQLYGSARELDEAGRLRMDAKELRDDVQARVKALWETVTTENVDRLTDLKGYKEEFLKLFGFGIPGVDYSADVDPVVQL